MKNILIIGSGNTGCQRLTMMDDYHTVFYKAVQEGIAIVTVEQIELERRLKKLSFVRNTLLPDPIICLDDSFTKIKEGQVKYHRQQH